MFSYRFSHLDPMLLAIPGDAHKMLEAKGQSHYQSRAGLAIMPCRVVPAGCWRPGHERGSDQGAEVPAPEPQRHLSR